MFIHNVVFYYYRAKLCVRQILPVTNPQFSPPMQHDSYDRYDYDIQENSFVSDNWATKWATLTRYIHFLSHVHWVLLKVVSDIFHRCLCYERSNHPLTKPMLCPPTYARIVGVLHKTFSEIQENFMQTSTKPTLAILESSPHINKSSNKGSLALTLNDNQYKANNFAQWDYNRRLNLSNKLKEMLNGVNLDYLYIIKPISGYVHPDKRLFRK